MRKLFLFLLLSVSICSCSKTPVGQVTDLPVTPSVAATENSTQLASPSVDPTPTTIATSVEVSETSEDSGSVEIVDSDDNTMDPEAYEKEIELLKKLLYKSDNEFTGKIGKSKIHMKLSYHGNKITGTYYYDKFKKEIEFNGSVFYEFKEYPSIYLTENTDKYGEFIGIMRTTDVIEGYWEDSENEYPMYLIREGSNAKPPEKPNEDTKSYEGHWYGKKSDYYSGTNLTIKALFDDMIYFDLEAINGVNLGSFSGTALLDQSSATALLEDYYKENFFIDYQLFKFTVNKSGLNLKSNNYNYGCGLGVFFDKQYSKKEPVINEPTAIDVGIVNTSEQDQEFRKLVGSCYSNFITYTSAVAYDDIILEGNRVKAGKSILRGLDGYCYYIVSDTNIYAAIVDDIDIKYFTNDPNYLDHMPRTMQTWADEWELPITYCNAYQGIPLNEDVTKILKEQQGQIDIITNAEAFNCIGKYYYSIGDNDSAIKYYINAILHDPDNSVYLANIGDSYYNIGEYDAAIYYEEKCIQIDPKYTAAYITKGDAYYFSNNFDDAVACYNKAINLPSGDTSYVYYSKGAALYFSGHYEKALKAYDMAIKKDPGYIDPYNNKGDTLNKLGRYEDAWKVYDQVLKMQPGNSSALIGKGNSFYYQEKYVEAIKYFDMAIASNPRDLTAYSTKAYSYFYLANYSKCLKTCNELIGINANYAGAYYVRSMVYAIQGKDDYVIANLQKAVKLDSNYIENIKDEKIFNRYRDLDEFKKIM